MMSICKSEGVGMLKARWRSCYKVKSTEQSNKCCYYMVSIHKDAARIYSELNK